MNKAQKNLLTGTLRDMYNTFQHAGCDLVAIEFRYKGTVWKADTPEEAVALRNELERSDKVLPPPHEAMEKLDAFWTPDRFMDVIDGIGELQRRFLIAIRRKPLITSKDLVKEISLDSEVALAGVISGLSKQLKQLDVEPKQVFLIEVKWTGKTKTRRFMLEEFFLGAGEDQNWPDAWAKKVAPRQRRRRDAVSNDSRATKKGGAGEQ